MLACKLCGFTGESDQYCLDTKPFYEVKGAGHVCAHPGDFLINITGYFVS